MVGFGFCAFLSFCQFLFSRFYPVASATTITATTRRRHITLPPRRTSPRLHRPPLGHGNAGLDNVRDRVEPFVVPGENARPEFVASIRWDLAVVVARDGAEEHVVGSFGFGVGFFAVAVAVAVVTECCRAGNRRRGGCDARICDCTA